MLNGIPVVPVVIIVLGVLVYVFRKPLGAFFDKTKSQVQAQADQVQAEVKNAVNQAQTQVQAKVDQVKTDINNLTK